MRLAFYARRMLDTRIPCTICVFQRGVSCPSYRADTPCSLYTPLVPLDRCRTPALPDAECAAMSASHMQAVVALHM